MIQTPISSNRRYLSVFFIVATILLLVATIHVSHDGIPEVIKSSKAWNRISNPASHGHAASAAPHGGAHDGRPTFADLAKDSGTDKVTSHNFGVLYDKYLPAFRDQPTKMLEIGLGCGMPYGPGASFETWIQYFSDLDINIIEYDQACGGPWASEHPRANVFFGDQSSQPFLRQSADAMTTDRQLDIIIDDGGHTMVQQEVSLRELWPYLRPGGVYIAEDLHTSYLSVYQGDPTRQDHTKRTFMRVIYELIDDFMMVPSAPLEPALIATGQKYPMSHEIQNIDCMEAMCVIVKKEVGAR